MRLLATAFLLSLAVSAYADPLTGVEGFEYRTYRHSIPPGNLADLKVGGSSTLSCDALGFTTDYSAVWDNIKNIADAVVNNKKTLLLGAAQYLLAKAAPSLYSVLAKLNSMAEMALKYNFDACALYKKAQAEASKSGSYGLSGLCMSVVGDPEVCSAPGRALQAVFGKNRVDVIDELMENPDTSDLIKAVVGTVIFEADGSSLETSYYAPTWKLADIYDVFYKAYYDKYKEIAEKVHDGRMSEDEYYDEYGAWITIGGEIDLRKVTISDGRIDLTEAKQGGYQIPYSFFYHVAQFLPPVAFSYVNQMAAYAAALDLQAFLKAIEKALTAGSLSSGKGGVLANQALIKRVESQYKQFEDTFGEATRENILALQRSALTRYKSLVASSLTARAGQRKLLESIFEGPPRPSLKPE